VPTPLDHRSPQGDGDVGARPILGAHLEAAAELVHEGANDVETEARPAEQRSGLEPHAVAPQPRLSPGMTVSAR
jgi:hypothetical protein